MLWVKSYSSAHGHINPVFPVLQELVQRGEQVICYNNEEFRPQIERTGTVFWAYPAQFILSAGRQTNIDELREIPSNFIVRTFVPQLEILQHADVLALWEFPW